MKLILKKKEFINKEFHVFSRINVSINLSLTCIRTLIRLKRYNKNQGYGLSDRKKVQSSIALPCMIVIFQCIVLDYQTVKLIKLKCFRHNLSFFLTSI